MYFFLYSLSPSLTKKIFNRGSVFVGNRQKQRDKPTLKREQHQQILEQLEKHRPTKSVSQEQPAAERTDVLYDFVSATELTAAHKKWPALIVTCFFFFFSPGGISSTVNPQSTSRY